MKVNVRYLRPDEKTGLLRYRRIFPVPLRPFIATVHGKSLTEVKRTLGARYITEAGALQRYEAAHRYFERLVGQDKKLAAGAMTR
jgi:hypothetical protein